jgi:hypothetical protein
MGSIAEGLLLRLLALTQVGGLGLLGLEDQWHKVSGLVRPIAEWLALGKAARAPGVSLPGFELEGGWLLGGDRWLAHGHLLNERRRNRWTKKQGQESQAATE